MKISLKCYEVKVLLLCVSKLNLNVVDNFLLNETVNDWTKVDEESRKHSLVKLLLRLIVSKPKR